MRVDYPFGARPTDRPGPERTTFVVTLFASAILFVVRTIEPAVLVQHLVEALAIVGLAALSYHAGSRQWLGTW